LFPAKLKTYLLSHHNPTVVWDSKGKVKDKIQSRTGHEGPEEE
jgi:hypothetical protein